MVGGVGDSSSSSGNSDYKVIVVSSSSDDSGSSSSVDSSSSSGDDYSDYSSDDVANAAESVFESINDVEDTSVNMFTMSDTSSLSRQDFVNGISSQIGDKELTSEDMEMISAVYDTIDADNSGTLSLSELSKYFGGDEDEDKYNITNAEMQSGLLNMQAKYQDNTVYNVDAQNIESVQGVFQNPEGQIYTLLPAYQSQILEENIQGFNARDFELKYSVVGKISYVKENDDGSKDTYRVVQDGDMVRIVQSHILGDNSQTTVSGINPKTAQKITSEFNHMQGMIYNQEFSKDYLEIKAQFEAQDPFWKEAILGKTTRKEDARDAATWMLKAQDRDEFAHIARERYETAIAQGLDISEMAI